MKTIVMINASSSVEYLFKHHPSCELYLNIHDIVIPLRNNRDIFEITHDHIRSKHTLNDFYSCCYDEQNEIKLLFHNCEKNSFYYMINHDCTCVSTTMNVVHVRANIFISHENQRNILFHLTNGFWTIWCLLLIISYIYHKGYKYTNKKWDRNRFLSSTRIEHSTTERKDVLNQEKRNVHTTKISYAFHPSYNFPSSEFSEVIKLIPCKCNFNRLISSSYFSINTLSVDVVDKEEEWKDLFQSIYDHDNYSNSDKILRKKREEEGEEEGEEEVMNSNQDIQVEEPQLETFGLSICSIHND